jgi:DNA-binding response OmpR family regulator
MKILIAEDDPVSLVILQRALEQDGHSVRTAANGTDAWTAFEADPVRLVISDWVMPELDGLELCRKVRARAKTDYTYFILLTAVNTGRERFREAMAAGVDDFLTKPLDREVIMTRLRVAQRLAEFTTQIRQLKQLIPICMYCKRIRDDSDYWQQLEKFLHTQLGSDFSHGVCPDCFTREIGHPPTRAGLHMTHAPEYAAE